MVHLLLEDLGRLGLRETLPLQAVVLLVRPPWPRVEPHFAERLQEWLRRRDLPALAAARNGELVALLFDPPHLAALRPIARAIQDGEPLGASGLRVGVSRRVALTDVPRGLREAQLAITAGFMRAGSSPFYQELGAARILLNLPSDFDLDAFVEDELGPVLEQDRLHNSDLVHTLAKLLSIDQRDDAAHALQIHRQTLYYRIGLLQELLGKDFLSAPRRLGLELAIMGREITSPRL
jgi:purine catabolism regulator